MNIVSICWILQQPVFISQESNNIWIFHTTLTQTVSTQTCLVWVDWIFKLAWLRLMAPDVEIGERYLLWKQEPAIWGREARAVSKRVGHSYKQSLCVLWCHEGWNREQMLIATTLCADSQLTWLQLFDVWSVLTPHLEACHKEQVPRPRTRIVPRYYSTLPFPI